MIFSSFAFLVFFTIFFTIYFLARNNHFVQNRIILAGSLIFYGWWDWRFLFLIAITIVMDYLIGVKLHATENTSQRKRLVGISVALNLSILGFFKYFNFFSDSLSSSLNYLGIEASYVTLNIILPVGISFYIFQSLSYVVDIYRKDVKPARSLVDYGAYVALFPQLVAGPIERGYHLLPQITAPRTITREKIYEGSYLILWGLFKKIFIADNLAQIVDPIFSGPGSPSGSLVLIGVYAFAFQIYCDFSAYTDIARGVAKWMGIDLMENFRIPYISKNPSEFWRRWHISLSSWLRDYLYIPLGGNKSGTVKTYRNLMITMVLGGLWHGAQANFVLWGLYQGAILVVHRFFTRNIFKANNEKKASPIVSAIQIALFFHVVCYGWLLFRAESMQQIAEFSHLLVTDVVFEEVLSNIAKLAFFTAPLIVMQTLQITTGKMNFLLTWPTSIRVAFYFGIIISALLFGQFGASEFIYFQF